MGTLVLPPVIIESLSKCQPLVQETTPLKCLVTPLWAMSLHWYALVTLLFVIPKAPLRVGSLYAAPAEFVRTLKGRLYVGDAPARDFLLHTLPS